MVSSTWASALGAYQEFPSASGADRNPAALVALVLDRAGDFRHAQPLLIFEIGPPTVQKDNERCRLFRIVAGRHVKPVALRVCRLPWNRRTRARSRRGSPWRPRGWPFGRRCPWRSRAGAVASRRDNQHSTLNGITLMELGPLQGGFSFGSSSVHQSRIVDRTQANCNQFGRACCSLAAGRHDSRRSSLAPLPTDGKRDDRREAAQGDNFSRRQGDLPRADSNREPPPMAASRRVDRSAPERAGAT